MENKLIIRTTDTTQYYIDWESLFVDEKEILSDIITKYGNINTKFDSPAAAYQILYTNNLATPEMTTGLSLDRVYTFKISVNDIIYQIDINGIEAQTINELLSLINNKLQDIAEFRIFDKNIYVSTKTIGLGSKIHIQDGNLWKSVTIFKYPLLPILGSNDFMDVLNTHKAPNGVFVSQMIKIKSEDRSIMPSSQENIITVEPIVIHPVVEPVVEPVIEPIVEPIVEPVVEPAVEPVTAPKKISKQSK